MDFLPVEVLLESFGNLTVRDLHALCSVSVQFHSIATELLYRHISVSGKETLVLSSSLALRPSNGRLVHSLLFWFSESTNDDEWGAIDTVLARTANLEELELYPPDDPIYLGRCPPLHSLPRLRILIFPGLPMTVRVTNSIVLLRHLHTLNIGWRVRDYAQSEPTSSEHLAEITNRLISFEGPMALVRHLNEGNRLSLLIVKYSEAQSQEWRHLQHVAKGTLKSLLVHRLNPQILHHFLSIVSEFRSLRYLGRVPLQLGKPASRLYAAAYML